ncbi:MAG: hypothetical protein WBX15_12145 [Thermoanaerobaculia bacterium]
MKRLIFIAPLAIVGIAAFIALGGEVVKLLWNWLLPSLFGFHAITFWQALGLLLLARILFGGVGRAHSHHSGFRRWRKERFDRMTPEERERFKQRMRERWGFDPAGSEDAVS